MNTEELKAKYIELTDITFNQGKLGDELDDYLTDDYVEHVTGPQHGTTDRAGYVGLLTALREGFPDIRFEVKHCVMEGDIIAVRNEWTGTNTGGFMGPPTGKQVHVEAMGFARFEGDKVAEHWGVIDMLGLMAQLGRLGPPGGGPPGGGPPGGPPGGGPPGGGPPA